MIHQLEQKPNLNSPSFLLEDLTLASDMQWFGNILGQRKQPNLSAPIADGRIQGWRESFGLFGKDFPESQSSPLILGRMFGHWLEIL